MQVAEYRVMVPSEMREPRSGQLVAPAGTFRLTDPQLRVLRTMCQAPLDSLPAWLKEGITALVIEEVEPEHLAVLPEPAPLAFGHRVGGVGGLGRLGGYSHRPHWHRRRGGVARGHCPRCGGFLDRAGACNLCGGGR